MERKELDAQTHGEVLTRDNYRCIVCGVKGVEVHEIVPRSALGKKKSNLLFNEKNRVCLCREHHSMAHTKEWRVYLIGLLKQLYNYTYEEPEFQRYINNGN